MKGKNHMDDVRLRAKIAYNKQLQEQETQANQITKQTPRLLRQGNTRQWYITNLNRM
jgi:hypothetical protein